MNGGLRVSAGSVRCGREPKAESGHSGLVSQATLAGCEPASRPDQLDLFATDSPGEGHKSPQPCASRAESRVYQLTELPGDTFEDIFGGAA